MIVLLDFIERVWLGVEEWFVEGSFNITAPPHNFPAIRTSMQSILVASYVLRCNFSSGW